MKTILFICFLAALTLPNVFAAPEWKPYDDFEGDLDAIDETPGQIPDLGTKWVQFVPENRLEMGIKDGVFQMKVKSPGGRDPGFKLVFGWEPRDILGIQFTVKVAELSEAGGWFGVLCTNEEPNWKNPNWVFGMSPSHQHNWGPKGVFGSGSVGQLGGWEAFSYEDIPENTNMLRTLRLEWNDAKHEMAVTVDPGEKTEWKKDDISSNADLGEFPWWSIYLTADQEVEVAVDDVFVKSESLPYPVEARGKLASRWGEIKLMDE